MNSHSLTFEKCQLIQKENQCPVKVKSQGIRTLVFRDSSNMLSIVEKTPTIESLAFKGEMNEEEFNLNSLEIMEIPKLNVNHMSELTSLTVNDLDSILFMPSTVTNLGLYLLNGTSLKTAVKNPLPHVSSLTVYGLSTSLPLPTLIKAICTAFPNLKHLTLPETIILNTSAANTKESDSSYLDGTLLLEPNELCKITILHSDNAWPMFLHGLLYELRLSFPCQSFTTSFEKLPSNESITFQPISLIDWKCKLKNHIHIKAEQYFKKIHQWFQLYCNQPQMKPLIDEMMHIIVQMCMFKSFYSEQDQQKLIDLLGNLNMKIFEFEEMKFYLKNVIEVRRKQLNFFLDFFNSVHECSALERAMQLLEELVELEKCSSQEFIKTNDMSEKKKQLNATCKSSDLIVRHVEELSDCVKEMEKIVMFNSGPKTIRPEQWYSEDIIEVYEPIDNIEIERDTMEDER
nr:unnamed protein product [Naegleria fowleri]